MGRNMKVLLAGMLIGTLPFLGMWMFDVYSGLENTINKVKVYERKPGNNVMRIYRTGADSILVEEPAKKGEYILLRRYLGKIPDEGDRKIEEAQIRKTVNWYSKEE